MHNSIEQQPTDEKVNGSEPEKLQQLPDPTDSDQVISNQTEDIDMLDAEHSPAETTSSSNEYGAAVTLKAGQSSYDQLRAIMNADIPEVTKEAIIERLMNYPKATTDTAQTKTKEEQSENDKDLKSIQDDLHGFKTKISGLSENKLTMKAWARIVRLRVPRPKRFKGNDALRLLSEVLEEHAQTWLLDKFQDRENYADKDFNFFLNEIVRKFEVKDNPVVRLERLKNLRIRTPTDVALFETYINELDPDALSPATQKYLFIGGLAGDLKDKLMMNPPATVDEAYLYARSHLSLRKRENEDSGHESRSKKHKTKHVTRTADKCSHCKKPGHIAAQCWKAHPELMPNKGKSSERKGQ